MNDDENATGAPPTCGACSPLPCVYSTEPAPVDTHPEHVWVWADGNYFDAVVIHREWMAYQRASMAAWEESAP